MSPFQVASQAVVDGNAEALRSLLGEHPGLVSDRSPKHGATLLHYVGANGPVEEEMQKTPQNAVEIAKLLIENGAHVDATIGDESATTPLVALVTSEFPAIAGLQGELVELFLESGAAVNGLKDDGYPLACALCFQYPDAINALVNGGARIDNIVSAASFGRMDFIRQCFDAHGKLRAEAVSAYPEPFMQVLEPAEILQTAIEHASHFKQQEVVEFLSQKNSWHSLYYSYMASRSKGAYQCCFESTLPSIK